MLKSFKAEGFILKRRDFGEADRLLSVFSLQKGKITILAKGVRRITSRRAGNIELLNRAAMFLHQGKNFLILTEATSLNVYENIKSDLTLMTYAYHILELIEKLMPENMPDPWVYENLKYILSSLSTNPRQIFIRAFEIKLLTHLGFANFTEKLLTKLLESSWENISNLSISEQEAMELERILRYQLEKIIETSLKSRTFLKRTTG